MRRRDVLHKVTVASLATVGAASVGAAAPGDDRLPIENATHVVVDAESGEKVTVEEYLARSDTGTLADLQSPSTSGCVAPCPGCCDLCSCDDCLCCNCNYDDCEC